jgi:hypothetical protein
MATGRTRGERTYVPQPRSDAYTGLLIIALVAQIIGAVFLFLDYKQYPDSKPAKVSMTVPPVTQPTGAGGGGAAVPPAGDGNPVPPGGGVNPGNPPAGGANPVPPPGGAGGAQP